MHCINHQEVAAVAICKCCGRGVCASCARITPLAVSCSDACSAQLQATQKLFTRSSNSLTAAGSSYRVISAILAFLGIACFGTIALPSFHDALLVFVGLGVICVVGAVVLFTLAKRFGK